MQDSTTITATLDYKKTSKRKTAPLPKLPLSYVDKDRLNLLKNMLKSEEGGKPAE